MKDKAQAIVDAIAVDKGLAEEKLEKARPALLEAELALQVCRLKVKRPLTSLAVICIYVSVAVPFVCVPDVYDSIKRHDY